MNSRSLVVFRRELKSYFLSPIAYVFGVLFLTVLLFLSAQSTLVHNAQASMQAFFLYLPWIYLVFLPGLTMRLWAEERKLGTIELLLTFPVRPGQVVLGKFLAVLTYLAFVLLLTFGLPLTLGAYGSVDWPPVLGAYLASLLFAGSFVAVGMFWSSLTKDQIVALLASVVSLAVLFLLGYPTLIDMLQDEALVWWRVTIVIVMFTALTVSAMMNIFWMYLIVAQIKRIFDRQPGEQYDDVS